MIGTDKEATIAAKEEYLHTEKITIQIKIALNANIQLVTSKIPSAVATPLPPLNL